MQKKSFIITASVLVLILAVGFLVLKSQFKADTGTTGTATTVASSKYEWPATDAAIGFSNFKPTDVDGALVNKDNITLPSKIGLPYTSIGGFLGNPSVAGGGGGTLSQVRGMAFGNDNRVYFEDPHNSTIYAYETTTKTPLAGWNGSEGYGYGLTMGPNGNLYEVNLWLNNVAVYDVKAETSAKRIKWFGKSDSGSIGWHCNTGDVTCMDDKPFNTAVPGSEPKAFDKPSRIIFKDVSFYVLENGNSRISIFNQNFDLTSTITNQIFANASDIAVDDPGNVYVLSGSKLYIFNKGETTTVSKEIDLGVNYKSIAYDNNNNLIHLGGGAMIEGIQTGYLGVYDIASYKKIGNWNMPGKGSGMLVNAETLVWRDNTLYVADGSCCNSSDTNNRVQMFSYTPGGATTYGSSGTAILQNFSFPNGKGRVKNASYSHNGLGTTLVQFSTNNGVTWENINLLNKAGLIDKISFKVTLTSSQFGAPILKTLSIDYMPATKPNKPTVLSPKDGLLASITPTLTLVQDFTDDDGGAWKSTTWQLSSDANFNSIVETGISTIPADQYSRIIKNKLENGKTYFWRAAFADDDSDADANDLATLNWSDPATFVATEDNELTLSLNGGKDKVTNAQDGAINEEEVANGDETNKIQVVATLSKAVNHEVQVYLDTKGTATKDEDYFVQDVTTGQPIGYLRILPNQLTGAVVLTAKSDKLVEGTLHTTGLLEDISINVSSIMNGTSPEPTITNSQKTPLNINLMNNDINVRVTLDNIKSTGATIGEGDGSDVFITLEPPTPLTSETVVTFKKPAGLNFYDGDYQIYQGGAQVAINADMFNIVIPAGQANTIFNFVSVDNMVPNDNQFVTIEASDVTNNDSSNIWIEPIPQAVTFTITDKSEKPIISLSKSNDIDNTNLKSQITASIYSYVYTHAGDGKGVYNLISKVGPYTDRYEYVGKDVDGNLLGAYNREKIPASLSSDTRVNLDLTNTAGINSPISYDAAGFSTTGLDADVNGCKSDTGGNYCVIIPAGASTATFEVMPSVGVIDIDSKAINMGIFSAIKKGTNDVAATVETVGLTLLRKTPDFTWESSYPPTLPKGYVKVNFNLQSTPTLAGLTSSGSEMMENGLGSGGYHEDRYNTLKTGKITVNAALTGVVPVGRIVTVSFSSNPVGGKNEAKCTAPIDFKITGQGCTGSIIFNQGEGLTAKSIDILAPDKDEIYQDSRFVQITANTNGQDVQNTEISVVDDDPILISLMAKNKVDADPIGLAPDNKTSTVDLKTVGETAELVAMTSQPVNANTTLKLNSSQIGNAALAVSGTDFTLDPVNITIFQGQSVGRTSFVVKNVDANKSIEYVISKDGLTLPPYFVQNNKADINIKNTPDQPNLLSNVQIKVSPDKTIGNENFDVTWDFSGQPAATAKFNVSAAMTYATDCKNVPNDDYLRTTILAVRSTDSSKRTVAFNTVPAGTKYCAKVEYVDGNTKFSSLAIKPEFTWMNKPSVYFERGGITMNYNTASKHYFQVIPNAKENSDQVRYAVVYGDNYWPMQTLPNPAPTVRTSSLGIVKGSGFDSLSTPNTNASSAIVVPDLKENNRYSLWVVARNNNSNEAPNSVYSPVFDPMTQPPAPETIVNSNICKDAAGNNTRITWTYSYLATDYQLEFYSIVSGKQAALISRLNYQDTDTDIRSQSLHLDLKLAPSVKNQLYFVRIKAKDSAYSSAKATDFGPWSSYKYFTVPSTPGDCTPILEDFKGNGLSMSGIYWSWKKLATNIPRINLVTDRDVATDIVNNEVNKERVTPTVTPNSPVIRRLTYSTTFSTDLLKRYTLAAKPCVYAGTVGVTDAKISFSDFACGETKSVLNTNPKDLLYVVEILTGAGDRKGFLDQNGVIIVPNAANQLHNNGLTHAQWHRNGNITIKGLAADTNYLVRVSAANNDKKSNPSDDLKIRTSRISGISYSVTIMPDLPDNKTIIQSSQTNPIIVPKNDPATFAVSNNTPGSTAVIYVCPYTTPNTKPVSYKGNGCKAYPLQKGFKFTTTITDVPELNRVNSNYVVWLKSEDISTITINSAPIGAGSVTATPPSNILFTDTAGIVVRRNKVLVMSVQPLPTTNGKKQVIKKITVSDKAECGYKPMTPAMTTNGTYKFILQPNTPACTLYVDFEEETVQYKLNAVLRNSSWWGALIDSISGVGTSITNLSNIVGRIIVPSSKIIYEKPGAAGGMTTAELDSFNTKSTIIGGVLTLTPSDWTLSSSTAKVFKYTMPNPDGVIISNVKVTSNGAENPPGVEVTNTSQEVTVTIKNPDRDVKIEMYYAL